MSDNNIQQRIGEKEMEKLRKNRNDKKDEKKAEISAGTIIIRAIGWIIAIAYFALLLFGKKFLPEEGTFLSSLDLFSGAENPNRWIRIASLCILTLSVSAILRLIISKMVAVKDLTKRTGRAVFELLNNLVKYVAYIVLIFLILNAVGVNTTELLAGLGILSLILGLGVTSLIEDVVAGVFIIIEHIFDVGDIIVLDGFRGTVVSIGIRSTKLADVGGDILTVRNSSIGSVVNLTDRPSCAALTIPIAPQESLKHVEAVIKNANISEIANKYPVMEGAPLYLGLCEITKKGVQMLLFIAPCKESNRYDVERALYHEIKTIFDNNNIQLGAPGTEE